MMVSTKNDSTSDQDPIVRCYVDSASQCNASALNLVLGKSPFSRVFSVLPGTAIPCRFARRTGSATSRSKLSRLLLEMLCCGFPAPFVLPRAVLPALARSGPGVLRSVVIPGYRATDIVAGSLPTVAFRTAGDGWSVAMHRLPGGTDFRPTARISELSSVAPPRPNQ